MSTVTADTATLLYEVFPALADNAERFTCREIEALAKIYRLHTLNVSAATLVDLHAEGDDEGDDHHQEEKS